MPSASCAISAVASALSFAEGRDTVVMGEFEFPTMAQVWLAPADIPTAFGIPVGHKNYAACYATGLLVARRTLKKFNLDEAFKGKEEIDGEDYHVEEEENDQRPLKVILDVGLQRTVVGARLWGVLKGAVDGGLHVQIGRAHV